MSQIFESKASPERGIARFHLIAKLFNIAAAQPETARVLELGCSSGTNLIAQALLFPKATFLGIDFDLAAIDTAKTKCQKLALQNCVFLSQDLLTLDLADQQFDYIVCHGLYSWVAPAVSARILQICSKHLSDTGVAYISYNTIPGWTPRTIIRKELLPLIDRKLSQQEQTAVALQKMQEILSDRGPSVDYEDMVIAEEINNILSLAPGLIYHELLAEHSRALSFSDFCSQIKVHQLKYLLESNLKRNIADWTNPQAFSGATWTDQLLQLEQNTDQRLNRSFRGSLLVRESKTLALPNIMAQAAALHFSSALVSQESLDLFAKEPAVFQTPNSGGIKVVNRLSKSVLQQLAVAWPSSRSFDELLELARLSLSDLSEAEIRISLQELGSLFWRGLIDCSFIATECKNSPGDQHECPIFPLARLEAEERDWATNIRLEYVQLDHFEQLYLQKHSTVSKKQIIAFIKLNLESGNLHLNLDGQGANQDSFPAESLAQLAEQLMQRLAEAGLLFH